VNGKTILLVDDSSTALMIHQMIISDNTPHQVITAKNGAEAVALALSAQPDLIVMDVVMPGMSGLQACQALRASELTKRIPIILVTTRGEQQAVESGYESGCNDYITKPVNPEELVALVDSYLGRQTETHDDRTQQ
jgi:CheY-like chemotaxis protein